MPIHRSRSGSIDRRFRLIAGILYVALIGLLSWQFTTRLDAYEEARTTATFGTRLRASLAVFDAIWMEQKTVIKQLDERGSDAQALGDELRSARWRTDQAIDALEAVPLKQACRDCPSDAMPIARIKLDLAKARRDADATLLRPPEARSVDNTMATVHELASVPSDVSFIDRRNVVGMMGSENTAQGLIYMVGFAANLHKEADALESNVATTLALHRKPSPRENQDIEEIMGSIRYLRDMVFTSSRALRTLPKATLDDVDHRFFGQAPDYVDRILAGASSPSGARSPVSEFIARFDAMSQPLIELRDQALNLAQANLESHLRKERAVLVIYIFSAISLTALLLLMSLRFHRAIVGPFIEARRRILAMADGDLHAGPTRRHYHGEIGELFKALGVLNDGLEEKGRLEVERDHLMAELRKQAETDPLTGLCNRRAFESMATLVLRRKLAEPCFIVLTMFDIDHFKRINDTYGHETGDVALKRLAELCRAAWGPHDVIGRIGGEEFAALSSATDPTSAVEPARRLLDSLHRERIGAIDGRDFAMTVSFGVTVARAGPAGTTPLLRDMLRHADQLLYQAKSAGRDRIETAPFSM